MSSSDDNAIGRLRRERRWSQAELAQRAGISRAAVSAIEQRRLVPSVSSALALARVLECTVEELFGEPQAANIAWQWAWQPQSQPCRYWQAEVDGRRWLYPAEPTGLGQLPCDGVCVGKRLCRLEENATAEALVVAGCDPAIGLLASEYARQSPFRMLPLVRSSSCALELLRQGKIHVAGVHLSGSRQSEGNAKVVREACGKGAGLLRVGVWQEGIALATHLKMKSPRQVKSSRLRWVGREPGSGARDCLDELLAGRTRPRRLAPDHRGVALAIQYQWADAGVCLRLTGEEAGLNFLPVRREAYDLCFPERLSADRRVRALIEAVRSSSYRRQLGSLPGYESRTTGDLFTC